MALGIQVGGGGDGGDRVPVVKYNAKAGRFYRIDRTQDAAGDWQTQEHEIREADFQAVMDLENIEVGWMMFATGAAPDFRMGPLGAPLPARPSDRHKQGFRMLMKLGKSIGGDAREIASTAGALINAVDALHNEYVKGKDANPGKLPIVAVAKIDKITSQGKNEAGQKITIENYAPVFAIKGWVDRPAELPADGKVAPPIPVAANEGSQQPVVQAVTTAQVQPEAVAAADLAQEF